MSIITLCHYVLVCHLTLTCQDPNLENLSWQAPFVLCSGTASTETAPLRLTFQPRPRKSSAAGGPNIKLEIGKLPTLSTWNQVSCIHVIYCNHCEGGDITFYMYKTVSHFMSLHMSRHILMMWLWQISNSAWRHCHPQRKHWSMQSRPDSPRSALDPSERKKKKKLALTLFFVCRVGTRKSTRLSNYLSLFNLFKPAPKIHERNWYV